MVGAVTIYGNPAHALADMDGMGMIFLYQHSVLH